MEHRSHYDTVAASTFTSADDRQCVGGDKLRIWRGAGGVDAHVQCEWNPCG